MPIENFKYLCINDYSRQIKNAKGELEAIVRAGWPELLVTLGESRCRGDWASAVELGAGYIWAEHNLACSIERFPFIHSFRIIFFIFSLSPHSSCQSSFFLGSCQLLSVFTEGKWNSGWIGLFNPSFIFANIINIQIFHLPQYICGSIYVFVGVLHLGWWDKMG